MAVVPSAVRASIALVYDEAQPRLVRVILLATAILTVMVSRIHISPHHINALTQSCKVVDGDGR